MTSMHNWWQDDALLWDALAAKRPGTPNLVGETAAEPGSRWTAAHAGARRGGLGLFERKLALGLAAGDAGAPPPGSGRGATLTTSGVPTAPRPVAGAAHGVGRFAKEAEPHLADARPSDVAIVLPQSLQLSVLGHYGRRGAAAVRARPLPRGPRLGRRGRRDQVEQLGNAAAHPPPVAVGPRRARLGRALEKVRGGATLLVTGRFDADEHFRPTGRPRAIGLDYEPGILATRENPVRWPGGAGRAVFSGDKSTYLEEALLPAGRPSPAAAWGRGRCSSSPCRSS